jgi:hypothetical protein
MIKVMCPLLACSELSGLRCLLVVDLVTVRQCFKPTARFWNPALLKEKGSNRRARIQHAHLGLHMQPYSGCSLGKQGDDLHASQGASKSIRNGCSSTIFMYRLVAPSRWADSKLLCCSDSMCQRQTKTCWRQRTLHSSASDPNPHILSQNSCSPPLPRTSQSPPKTDSRVETSTTGRRPLRLEISGHTGY